MDIAFWLISTLLAAIVSIVVGIIASEPLKEFCAHVTERIKTPSKKRILAGEWVATFEVMRNERSESYTEVIELSEFAGAFFGHLSECELNRKRRPNMPERPLRVTGTLREGKYFTGTWYHPLTENELHGSFQLVLDPSNRTMEGQWVGYDPVTKVVANGKWTWYYKGASALAVPDSDLGAEIAHNKSLNSDAQKARAG